MGYIYRVATSDTRYRKNKITMKHGEQREIWSRTHPLTEAYLYVQM